MIDIASTRNDLCDAISAVEDRLTVTPYRPKAIQLPHAWVEINTLTPAAYGDDVWNVEGQIVVAVSEADDDAAWELLDSIGADRISRALSEAVVVVDGVRIVNYGEDIDVAGQAFRSFTIEFTVMV